eukprot:scaffold89231_cov25-Tisochrysis_lutea.AAC.1
MSKGDHEPQRGQRQRRECGSTCANGLSAAPQALQEVGSRCTICIPSMRDIGEKRRPRGAPRASAPAGCGQRCHESRMPLARSSAVKSIPGPGWMAPGEERVGRCACVGGLRCFGGTAFSVGGGCGFGGVARAAAWACGGFGGAFGGGGRACGCGDSGRPEGAQSGR